MKSFNFDYENIDELFVLQSYLRQKADDIQMYIDRFDSENRDLGIGRALTGEQSREIDYALSILIHDCFTAKDGNSEDISLSDFLESKTNYCLHCNTQYQVFKQNDCDYHAEVFCCESCASHYKKIEREINDDKYVTECEELYDYDNE